MVVLYKMQGHVHALVTALVIKPCQVVEFQQSLSSIEDILDISVKITPIWWSSSLLVTEPNVAAHSPRQLKKK